jgi:hypothetical protein
MTHAVAWGDPYPEAIAPIYKQTLLRLQDRENFCYHARSVVENPISNAVTVDVLPKK